MKEKIEKILPLVTKPNRYVGNELNVIHKDHRLVDVKIALAFPDVYEIGQSYLGFHILYHIINQRADAVAERVFAPWPDLETLMRRHNIPLFCLESKKPLRSFEVVGFTLQHELTYSNILNMLDLGVIPLFSAERDEGDPIVLGGGPCAYNPEPLAEFFDAFVIGDGEETIHEIIDVIKERRRKGKRREETLREMAQIRGVYVPALYAAQYDSAGRFLTVLPKDDGCPLPIQARFIPRLESKNYPYAPVVPLTEVTHDRLAVEIMRGCTRGCRFCQAGMICRPLRERPMADILDQIRKGIAASGWDEVSLVSLSTSDYTCIGPLVKEIDAMLPEKHVAISLPSLRPDTFSMELVDSIKSVHKTGLTFAPEAGTQRLRDVINKNQDGSALFRAVEIAASRGWRSIKLYFMIGLPTETYEDLDGIIRMVKEVVAIGKRVGKGLRVNVTLSPFCPKPHTPFQWDAQDELDALEEKSRYLNERISSRAVALKWRNPEISLIEAAFARGDRRLSSVLRHAWKAGAKFDEWSEFFDFQRWLAAFDAASVDLKAQVGARTFSAPLPWGHISTGVTKSYLERERKRAALGETTPDCRSEDQTAPHCNGCGVADPHDCMVLANRAPLSVQSTAPSSKLAEFGRKRKRRMEPATQLARSKVRVKYLRGPEVRFVAHLDVLRMFDRAIRRAELPIAYSQGYHPHPKMAFGPPLPVGMESQAEYVDLQFSDPFLATHERALHSMLPMGFRILELKPIFGKTAALTADINLAEYTIDLNLPSIDVDRAIDMLLSADELWVERQSKRTTKTVNIRPGIRSISRLPSPASGDTTRLGMTLQIGERSSVRPTEVLQHLLSWPMEDLLALKITRTGLYIERNGSLLTPMQVI